MLPATSDCEQTAPLAGINATFSGNVDGIIKRIIPQRDDIIKQAVKAGGK
jgi:hypothetical protein